MDALFGSQEECSVAVLMSYVATEAYGNYSKGAFVWTSTPVACVLQPWVDGRHNLYPGK